MKAGDPRFDLTGLPHGDAARLVSGVIEIHDDRITCEARIAPDSAWVARDRCPSFVGLEAAAQAAALLGDERIEETAGRERAVGGYLVRARNVICTRRDLPVGVPFLVSVRRAGCAPPLFVFSFEVGDRAGRILAGQISIYLERAEPPAGHISAKQNH